MLFSVISPLFWLCLNARLGRFSKLHSYILIAGTCARNITLNIFFFGLVYLGVSLLSFEKFASTETCWFGVVCIIFHGL